MLSIGLTGGIGSGKTQVGRALARHGATVIDADRLAREVVSPGTEGLAAVVRAFGEGILGPGGVLDRPALAKRVFGDPPARRRLEAIVHPLVRARSAELAAATPPDGVVVNDVPLLVESGLQSSYHLVVVVQAAERVRVQRLVRDRGMSVSEARERMAAQTSDERRLAAADVVIVNESTLEELRRQVDQLWAQRIAPYARNLAAGEVPPRWVRLVDYDPTWRAQFQRIAARVQAAAGGAAKFVDHVGSTAVTGMAAKDIIDVQLVVDSLAVADELAPSLQAAGFLLRPGQAGDAPAPPESDPVRWAKRFHVSADPGRPVHLHVRAADSAGERSALLFRDFLRARIDEAVLYLGEKRRLAARHRESAAYTAAKQGYVERALERASRWAQETGWTVARARRGPDGEPV